MNVGDSFVMQKSYKHRHTNKLPKALTSVQISTSLYKHKFYSTHCYTICHSVFSATAISPVLCSRVFVCRSKQSCGDGCGGVTIKILSPQPSKVSLRSQFEPAGGGHLPVATSLQYNFMRPSMRV